MNQQLAQQVVEQVATVKRLERAQTVDLTWWLSLSSEQRRAVWLGWSHATRRIVVGQMLIAAGQTIDDQVVEYGVARWSQRWAA